MYMDRHNLYTIKFKQYVHGHLRHLFIYEIFIGTKSMVRSTFVYNEGIALITAYPTNSATFFFAISFQNVVLSQYNWMHPPFHYMVSP